MWYRNCAFRLAPPSRSDKAGLNVHTPYVYVRPSVHKTLFDLNKIWLNFASYVEWCSPQGSCLASRLPRGSFLPVLVSALPRLASVSTYYLPWPCLGLALYQCSLPQSCLCLEKMPWLHLCPCMGLIFCLVILTEWKLMMLKFKKNLNFIASLVALH